MLKRWPVLLALVLIGLLTAIIGLGNTNFDPPGALIGGALGLAVYLLGRGIAWSLGRVAARFHRRKEGSRPS